MSPVPGSPKLVCWKHSPRKFVPIDKSIVQVQKNYSWLANPVVAPVADARAAGDDAKGSKLHDPQYSTSTAHQNHQYWIRFQNFRRERSYQIDDPEKNCFAHVTTEGTDASRSSIHDQLCLTS
ncbi:hypothetical protein LENED_003831 [Lentinula edodes]|uniref:Uncharacterized protein n=1 Tax=Lentinula edodes TaxID=5353 RepID=A0A1Q3E503_LENED|nr:hypothetical protein LENED_003831 [Lentinula edodes]